MVREVCKQFTVRFPGCRGPIEEPTEYIEVLVRRRFETFRDMIRELPDDKLEEELGPFEPPHGLITRRLPNGKNYAVVELSGMYPLMNETLNEPFEWIR